MAVTVPHFSLPFRYVNGRPAVNEQDTIDDVADCVEAILLTRPGDRDEYPEFGTPDLAFSQQPLDHDAIVAAVRDFETRAELLGESEVDRLNEAVARVRLTVNVEDNRG